MSTNHAYPSTCLVPSLYLCPTNCQLLATPLHIRYCGSVLPFKHLHFPNSKDLELVLVECLLNSQTPNATSEVLEKLYDVLSSLRPQTDFSNLVLCGDFNIQPSSNRSNDSLSYLQSYFQVSQIVNEPTSVLSSSSIIDLIFLSNPNTLVSCGTLAPLANSDHYTVQVIINISSKKTSSNPPRKQVRMYSQTDFSLANQLLKELPVASCTDNIDLF